jgi:hypothetical protein
MNQREENELIIRILLFFPAELTSFERIEAFVGPPKQSFLYPAVNCSTSSEFQIHL